MPQTQLANLGPGGQASCQHLSASWNQNANSLTCPLLLLLGMLDQLWQHSHPKYAPRTDVANHSTVSH